MQEFLKQGDFQARTLAKAREPVVGPLKLIVSDFDGTLLPESYPELEAAVPAMIHAIHEAGLIFAAASGRHFTNLSQLMADYAQEVIFLSNNGAQISDGHTSIGCFPLPPAAIPQIVAAIERVGATPVISGLKATYLFRLPRQQKHLYLESLGKIVMIKDLAEIPDTVIKISAYHAPGILEIAADLARQLGGQYQADISGRHWQDFTLASKGKALRYVLQELQLRPDQVLCFGDNYNDRDMLSLAGYSYAMVDAVDEVKSYAQGLVDHVPTFVQNYLKTRRIEPGK